MTESEDKNMEYQKFNGTSYRSEMPMELIEVLETARKNKTPLVLRYGDLNGKDWMEECDCVGRIGRSTGTRKVPLIIAEGECSGPELSSIVKVVQKSSGKVLYQHPNYHRYDVKLVPSNEFGYVKEGWFEDASGEWLVARFEDEKDARNWFKLMTA